MTPGPAFCTVAGVIFTLPAFLIAGLWDTVHYWEATILMGVGYIIGPKLAGAFYTLFKLREPLTSGMRRAIEDMLKGSSPAGVSLYRGR